MPSVVTLNNAKHLLLTCSSAPKEITEEWFSVDYWQAKDCVTGSSQGRSATHFIEHNNAHYALRHYHRGGMVRHILRDTYYYLSLQKTRVYQELSILEKLQEWGLKAPRPIAGQIIRSGLGYRSDILMARIPGACDLYQALSKRVLPNSLWRNIGQTIAEFHRYGVYHADLNCHNIMLDRAQNVWLIDFDRATLQSANSNNSGWQAQNIGRLYRSFNKEKELASHFQFSEQSWEQLLRGYDT